MISRCLACYEPVEATEGDFHPDCARRIFGQPAAPILPYSENDLNSLGREVIHSRSTVTGVQPKISLRIMGGKKSHNVNRFTIVGLWGDFILKPPSPVYPDLPAVEDVTMHLARISGIDTASHSLIRMNSGNLSYITRRMDRRKGRKVAMEDMCQLSGRITDLKYQGSYEQVAKILNQYSMNPGLDLVDFFRLVIFSFLTGNADMHLKNFSLLEREGGGMVLSPAYDLVNTAIVNPADKEELALTLNGKKNRLSITDFTSAMTKSGIHDVQQENIFSSLAYAIPKWSDMIEKSHLSAEMRSSYLEIVAARATRLDLF